nr:MAG: hypothetical protein [Sanya fiers-like virus 29]
MPQISNIVINDGAATPVAHTFAPIGRDAKGVFWYEQITPTPANPLEAKRISYTQTRELDPNNRSSGRSKAIYALYVPTIEDWGGGIPPKVVFEEISRLEFRLSERSAKQKRKDTRVLSMNLLGSTAVQANIDDLQTSYG